MDYKKSPYIFKKQQFPSINKRSSNGNTTLHTNTESVSRNEKMEQSQTTAFVDYQSKNLDMYKSNMQQKTATILSNPQHQRSSVSFLSMGLTNRSSTVGLDIDDFNLKGNLDSKRLSRDNDYKTSKQI